MAVTEDSFKGEFPQYATSSRVAQCLAQAEIRVGEAWGELRDEGIKYLTAHLLAIDPLSESATRATAANGAANFGKTTWLTEFERLQACARAGFFGTAGG